MVKEEFPSKEEEFAAFKAKFLKTATLQEAKKCLHDAFFYNLAVWDMIKDEEIEEHVSRLKKKSEVIK